VFTLAFWAFVPGILGARAFYVIEYWDEFQRGPDTFWAILNLTQGGLVVYGSVIGGIAGLAAFIYRYKMPPLATLDLVVPSFVLGMAIGRIGCLLNGCCYGGVCDLPWAVTFPAGSPAHRHQVEHGETFLQGLKIAGAAGAEPAILEVQPGSPAGEQGLEPGQRIVSVNGVPVRTVDGAQRELLGAQETDQEIMIGIEAAGGDHPGPVGDHPHGRAGRVRHGAVDFPGGEPDPAGLRGGLLGPRVDEAAGNGVPKVPAEPGKLRSTNSLIARWTSARRLPVGRRRGR
jgi:hypothetical protein